MTTESKPTTDSTTAQTSPPGRFVWYDLMTTDVPAATAFYTAITGWGTQDFDMGPGGTYQMWTVGSVPIGGVMPNTPTGDAPAIPPHWMAHVAVANVDETVAQAESLGGTVISPAMDIPTVGRFAVIADPQGAVVSVFASLQPGTGDFAPKLGEVSWHELMTSDHAAAFAFYSALFGWEKQQEMDMGAMGTYLMFGEQNGGAMYGGMMTITPDMPMPPSWLYYIQVDSADATAEQAKSLGGQVLFGPMDVPGGDRVAQIMDPQGAMFGVHSRKKS